MLQSGRAHGLLHRQLRREVRHRGGGLGARAERAHQQEALQARELRRRDEVLGPFRHDPMEILTAALDDRDEVDDVRAAVDRGLQALRVGDVALDHLGAPARRARRAFRPAREHPHVALLGTQRVHDLRPDEARAAGDEDFHVKFCQ